MWKPTGDRILIRFETPAEMVTPGGLILAAEADHEVNKQADVIATGPQARDVKVGDRILISAFAGTTVPGDEDARICHETDVMGVVA